MSRVQGFPAVGPSIPGFVIPLATALVGAATAWAVIGWSGWLAVAGLLLVGAAVLPRAPFFVLLIVQLAVALVSVGDASYTGRLVVLLAGTHLVFTGSLLAARLPPRSRLQLATLRRPLVVYVAVQLPCQIAAFVLLALVAGGTDGTSGSGRSTHYDSAVWLGVIGAVAALALAVAVLLPVLERPARR